MALKRIRRVAKKLRLIEHRRFMLDRAFELLTQGWVDPNYVTVRANKLKEVVKGAKGKRKHRNG